MNTTGKFKVLSQNDPQIAQVIELDQKDFPRPWKPQEWLDLDWKHHLLMGSWFNDEMQAFALFGHVAGDDTAHLLKICVMSSKRGSGLSQEFWTHCLDRLRELGLKNIYLEVESPNQRAIAFYQKAGFQLLRRIKAYYSDGTDAETMQVTI